VHAVQRIEAAAQPPRGQTCEGSSAVALPADDERQPLPRTRSVRRVSSESFRHHARMLSDGLDGLPKGLGRDRVVGAVRDIGELSVR
jgi:hypothetical protein